MMRQEQNSWIFSSWIEKEERTLPIVREKVKNMINGLAHGVKYTISDCNRHVSMPYLPRHENYELAQLQQLPERYLPRLALLLEQEQKRRDGHFGPNTDEIQCAITLPITADLKLTKTEVIAELGLVRSSGFMDRRMQNSICYKLFLIKEYIDISVDTALLNAVNGLCRSATVSANECKVYQIILNLLGELKDTIGYDTQILLHAVKANFTKLLNSKLLGAQRGTRFVQKKRQIARVFRNAISDKIEEYGLEDLCYETKRSELDTLVDDIHDNFAPTQTPKFGPWTGLNSRIPQPNVHVVEDLEYDLETLGTRDGASAAPRGHLDDIDIENGFFDGSSSCSTPTPANAWEELDHFRTLSVASSEDAGLMRLLQQPDAWSAHCEPYLQ